MPPPVAHPEFSQWVIFIFRVGLEFYVQVRSTTLCFKGTSLPKTEPPLWVMCGLECSPRLGEHSCFSEAVGVFSKLHSVLLLSTISVQRERTGSEMPCGSFVLIQGLNLSICIIPPNKTAKGNEMVSESYMR